MKSLVEEHSISRFRFLRPPGHALLAVYFLLSLLAILYIPYRFPVAPTGSDSYVFGYNNTAGELLVLLSLSFAAFWTRGLKLDFSSNGKSSGIPLRVLWISLVIELTVCTGVYLQVGRYGAFGDSQYEIHRIWLVSLGKVPYRDFEWIYGSGLLYVPAWFSRWFHLSIPDAYFLFWAIAFLAGVALLFATINLVDFPSNHKTAIFLLFYIPAAVAPVYMGLSSTPLRSTLPLFCLLLLYNLRRQASGTATIARVAVLAVLSTAVIILISPEMAIAFVVAFAVVFCPLNVVRLHGLKIVPYLFTLIVLFLVLSSGFELHAFDGVRAAGRGGISLPITFAPATLIFFGVIFVCVCYVVRRILDPAIRDNTIVLLVFGLPMTASALGRCDAGHILSSGAAFFISAGFYASKAIRAWKLYRAAVSLCASIAIFYTIMIMLSILINGAHWPTLSSNADLYFLFPNKGHAPAGPAADLASPGAGPSRSGSEEILEAPFGFTPRATGFYYSSQIDYGYYDGMTDIFSDDAVRRKIIELSQNPDRDLLLPADLWGGCDGVDAQMRRKVIGYLLLSPYSARAVHIESLTRPLCDYIRAHYIRAAAAIPRSLNYELWSPKPAGKIEPIAITVVPTKLTMPLLRATAPS